MSSETTRLVPRSYNGNSLDIERYNGEDNEYNATHQRSSVGDCAKAFVFGGTDGAISSLIIIAGCYGGSLPWRVSLTLGLANIAANSLSIGISEFLSSKAHREFLQAEKRRELWEFKNYREAEIGEMIGRFEARGMSRQDAELVVSKIAQYENFFVGLMVSEELGLQLSEDDDAMLITDAFVMFIAFASVGLIPVLTLLIGAIDTFSDEFVSSIAVVTSLVLVLFLGILKSHYSSTSWVYSALEALLSGGVCFGASFIVGKTLMSAAEAI